MFQFSFNFDSSERLFFQQSSRVEFYLSIDFNFLNFLNFHLISIEFSVKFYFLQNSQVKFSFSCLNL